MIKLPADRKSILNILGALSYKVPDHGEVNELMKSHTGMDFCIVYFTDGNKEKMRLIDALNKYPSHFAIMYVGQQGNIHVTTRFIQIGIKAFWLEYTSVGDWRSNKGTAEIFKMENDGYHAIKLPMFSIDFIRSDRLRAFDFDTLPALRGTGIDKMLGQKRISLLIKTAQRHFRDMRMVRCQ